ncbi:MAG: TIGR02921 family PEP-CTERM protein [Myxococcota bacterium]
MNERRPAPDHPPPPGPRPDPVPRTEPERDPEPDPGSSTPPPSSWSWRAGLRRAFAPRVLIHVLFWSWHAVWLLGVVFGLVPHVLPDLLVDTFEGQVPWGITLSAVTLALLPLATLVGGWRLRHDHWRLFRLFYGVGGVAFSLLLFRLFFIREATPGVQLLLGTLAAGAAFYLAELFGGLRRLGRGAAIVRMVGNSALLIIGVYAGVTLGLYAVPTIILTIPEIFEAIGHALTHGRWLRLVTYSPFIFVFFVFVLYSFTLLLGLPLAVAVLYTRGYVRGLRAWSMQRPWVAGVTITAATIALWLVAFVGLSTQPQPAAFARLAERPGSIAAQEDHLAHAESIRDGLVNAYLAPHRYWGARGGNVQLARLYREAFGASADVMGPQHLFNAMAAPLLYDGDDMAADRARAEIRYEQFFDRPLQDGERDEVLDAVSATYDRTQAEAGLLDVGQRKVRLTQQDLRIEVDGDLARVSLHEIYVNQTWEQQEIFYYFNLPEHAAVTGLWLGDTEDSRTRFPYVVAPRGAAQQVYKEQRQRRVDPALLEQVGPRQYRLRAFPIPPRNRRQGGVAPPMHLWMEWTVLHDGTGWPTPQLAQARNVYWDEQTQRTFDGAPTEHEGWLPPRMRGDAVAREHRIDLGGFRVTAEPANTTPAWPTGRLAVVLETSLSMKAHAPEVDRVLSRLVDEGVAADLYLAPSPYGAQEPRRIALGPVESPVEPPVEPLASPHYYGGHTLVGALAQFDRLRGDTRYAAILVLSDEGSFALLQDEASAEAPGRGRPPQPGVQTLVTEHARDLRRAAAAVETVDFDAPVWLLHFGGLPHAYRDQVGDLLQRTHGGVATDLDDVLARLGDGPVDGYRWRFEPRPATEPDEPGEAAFAPLAARALVGHLAQALDLQTLEGLDRIHEIAVQAGIVTSWSSMIVLVNDAQREALRRAAAAEDRFDREAESGTEATTTPFAALELAATPEPEEWLLLGLVLLAVIWRLRSLRRPVLAGTPA